MVLLFQLESRSKFYAYKSPECLGFLLWMPLRSSLPSSLIAFLVSRSASPPTIWKAKTSFLYASADRSWRLNLSSGIVEVSSWNFIHFGEHTRRLEQVCTEFTNFHPDIVANATSFQVTTKAVRDLEVRGLTTKIYYSIEGWSEKEVDAGLELREVCFVALS